MRIRTLAATTLGVAAAASAGSIASRTHTSAWYTRLDKPSYVPPSGVFPIAWTSLYADIAGTSAVAIDRLLGTGQHRRAHHYITALAINLVLNAGWSWLFFKYRRLGSSAVGAAALAISSADLSRRTIQAEPRAGLALLPYPLWCAFATVMSAHIWRLNH
jgi:tryptophan-rich sensory protein